LANTHFNGLDLKGFMLRIDRLDARHRLQQAEETIRALEQRVAELSLQEPVTGLPNHRHFADRLSQALRLAQRHGHVLGLLILDIDRFRRINDLVGLEGSEDVLRQLAGHLQEALREGDTLACLGGGRFMILLPQTKDMMATVRVGQKLLETVQAPIHVGARELDLTASIGICVHPQDGLDAQTLESHAESALYRAKERGGNRIECFTSTLNEVSLERQELESALRCALQNSEMQLYYQPQFFMDGRLAGAEALLRWNHPLLGAVPPTKFIPLAEESRLILPIGEWALRQACSQMAKWQALSPTPLILAVNVSVLQFANGDWDACVSRALSDTGLDPQCLELELTESLVMRHGNEDLAPLHRLREIGARIAIDDFGTGYSSLSYLQRLPITTLKLDQSFIAALQEEDPATSSENIIKAIIQLAHGLNLIVVAEGVETEGQRDMLELLDCDCLQGFLLGRPIPADAFEALLEFMSVKQFLNKEARPAPEALAPRPTTASQARGSR
jgi:diguanylate cyclase (GGDEF)-like protein